MVGIALAVGLWVFVLGNAAGIIWIWGQGGGDALGYHWHTFDDVLLGLGRLTALLSGYLALIEVVLLARLPFLERLVGFDRLTVWHRWNGHAVLDLALAHVVFSVWGYAKQDQHNFFREYWNWLTLPQPKAPDAVGAASGAISKHPSILTISQSPTSPYPGIITPRSGRPSSSRCSSRRSWSCAGSCRTSGGTPSTSRPTPGSRSRGST